MGFRSWRPIRTNSKKQLQRRNEKRRRGYVARQYEHLLFEPLEWRQLLTVTLAPIAGSDAGGVFKIPSGKVLYVPLTGADTGNTVSYSATSSDSQVQVHVMDGNPTLQLQVHGTRSGGATFSGTLNIELFDNLAHDTVQTISNLVNSGVYNGKQFYRIVPNFVIQGGLQGSPAEPQFPDEFNALLSFNSPGLLAMANPGNPDKNTSEFFVTDIDLPLSSDPQHLNFRHNIFGQLTSGFNTYQDIMNAQGITSDNSTPSPAVIIDSATIVGGGDQSAVLQVIVPNDFTGVSSINVTATSSDTSTAAQSFNINAAPATTPTDSQPIILAPVTDKLTTTNAPISFPISASVLSGVTLDSTPFSVTGSDEFRSTPQHVTVQVTPGANNTATVTLTPAAGFTGSIDLVLHADDSALNYHDAMRFALNVVAPVAMTSHTNPVNVSTGPTASVGGTGEPDATISVVVSDGTHSTNPQTTTVAQDGTWSIGGINLSSFDSGNITYTATDTTNNTTPATASAVFDVTSPTVVISPVGPINNTNVANFTVNGTGEVGSTISLVVSDGSTTAGPLTTTVNDAGNWTISNINLTSLLDGTITMTATATDAGDNSAQDSEIVTKDVVAPDVSITTASNPITLENITTASISGTGEVDATITLVITDGTHSTDPLTTTVAGNGTWSFAGVDLKDLDDGTITYQATAADAAGNEASDTSDAVKLAVAVTAFTNPINLANVASASIGGTGAADVEISVEISDGNAGHTPITETATIGSNGLWSITGIDLSALDDGTITYKVTATDAEENSVELTRTALMDVVAPAIAITGVTNPINASNASNVVVSGTTDVGATVVVKASINGNETGTVNATVDSNGQWTATIDVGSLADGTLSFTATATDAVANSAADTETAAKDTVAPVVTISSATDPITSGNQSNASISGNVTGTGSEATTITVVINDNDGSTPAVTRTATVSSDGSWSITDVDLTSLDDGQITYSVTAADVAGNASAPATLNAVKSVADNSLSGFAYVDADGDKQKDTNEAILGGILVTLLGVDPGGNPIPSQTTTTASDGSYHFDNLPAGTYTLREAQPSQFKSSGATAGNLGGQAAIDIITQIVISGGQDGTDYNFGEKGLKSSLVTINDFLASTPPAQERYNNAVANGTSTATVESIAKLDADPANGSQVRYTVTFNRNVSGVDAADFQVIAPGNHVTGASIASVSGSGKTYTVTVNTGTGSGMLGLALRDNDSILDSNSGKLGGTGTGNGDFVAPYYNVSKALNVSIDQPAAINSANQHNISASGTAEANSTVKLTISNGANSLAERQTTANNSGNWTISNIDVSTLPEGTITFSATATVGSVTSAPATKTTSKDTVAPAVAITSATNPIGDAQDQNVNVSGTVEVGSTVSVVATDGTTTTSAVSATVDASGNWSIAGFNVSSLQDGSITFTATATDAAGNTATGSTTATKDTVAPAVAITMVTPTVINSANQSSVGVSGTAEADASITLSASNGANSITPLTTTADSNGNWSVSNIDVSTLADGTIIFRATASDAAGNPANATQEATKDTVAPAVTLADPPIIILGNETNYAVSGTGEAGATVAIVIGDGTNPNITPAAATVGQDGLWTIAGIDLSGLSDGTITFTVSATDAAANTSAPTSKTAQKITTAPEVALSEVTDPIGIDNQHSTTASGTSEEGVTISVVASDGTHTTAPKSVVVGNSGTWTIVDIDVSALDDGTITYTATATDIIGNTATSDLTATKTTVAITSVTDPINAANQASVSAAGVGEPNASIALTIDDGDDQTAPIQTTGSIDLNGDWSISGIDVSSLTDGTLTFTVTATSANDNTASKSLTAAKDTVAPAVDITSVTDPIVSANLASVAVSGTGEAGASVTVVIGDGANSDITPPAVTVGEDGHWTIAGIDVSSLADGAITFMAVATDNVGNSSAPATATATKDTVAPELSIGDVTDPIGLANYHSTAIQGTGEAGASVKVIATDGTTSTSEFTTTVGQDGNWSISGIDVGTLNDGTITYHVTATDEAGNETDGSATATKATVAITSATDPVNGSNVAHIAIGGTGEVDAAIAVVVTDGTTTTSQYTTTIDAGGTWSISDMDASALADGTITYMVTATDSGSHSATASKTALKDTEPPALRVLDYTHPIGIGNQHSLTVQGIASPEAIVSVFVTDGTNSTTVLTTMADPDHTEFTISGIDVSALADGQVTYKVTATDPAGNERTDDKETGKSTVAITAVTDPIILTNATTTSIVGTGEANADISVVASDSDSATTTEYTTTINADGNWSIANIDVSALKDGVITYTATATDADSNSATSSKTATKNTVAITMVTDPINAANQASVSIGGTSAVGAIVAVAISDGVNPEITGQTVIVDGSGHWSIEGVDVTALADGELTFTATATLGANVGHATMTATKDVVAPSIVITSATNPIGTPTQSNTTASGTTEAGATIVLYVTDALEMTTTYNGIADGSGHWTISGIDVSALNDGAVGFVATATDLAGNTSLEGVRLAYKDTVAPTVEMTLVTEVIDFTNFHNTSASGTVESGAIVSVVASDGTNSTAPVTAVVENDGSWSATGIDVSLLLGGVITFTATATDSAGNTATDSLTAMLATVSITSVTDPIVPTNDDTTTASGTGSPGAAIALKASDASSAATSEYTTTIAIDGTWTISDIDVSMLVDGQITYTATATFGAETSVSTKTATKDTTPPTLTIDADSVTNPINIVNAASTSLSGTVEPGLLVAVTVTDGITILGPFAAVVEPDGAWAADGIDVSSLFDSTLTYSVTATDAAGNSTQTSRTANKETVAPNVTGLTLTDPNPTLELTVHFTVVFSEAVTGVGTSSFTTVPGGDVLGASIDNVSGSGDTYTVTVSFGGGAGTIGLNVNDVDQIFDLSGNPLGGLGDHNGDFTGEVYTVGDLSSAKNVFDFGAVGDGVADDTAAIQAAIDAAIADGGGVVYIPAGTFAVSASLVVQEASNVHIIGAGKGQTVLVSAPDLGSYTFHGTSTAAVILLSESNHCSVRNLTVDKRGETSTYNGISLWYGFAGGGTPSSNCDIVDCEVLSSGTHYSYQIWLLNAQHSRVLNCTVDGGKDVPDLGDDSSDGIEAFGGYDIEIRGNNVKRVDGIGIHLFQDPLLSDASHDTIVVTDNVVETCFRGIGGPIAVGTHNVTIANNTITGSIGRGIGFTSNSAVVIEKLNILNNEIENCNEGVTIFSTGGPIMSDVLIDGNTVTGTTSTNTGAIYLQGCNNVQVSNNQISNTTLQSIRLNSCDQIQILDNTCDNSGTEAASKHVQIWTSSNVLIQDNWFGKIGVAGSVIRTDGSSSNINLVDNTFDNSGGLQSWAAFFADVTGGSIVGNQLVNESDFYAPAWVIYPSSSNITFNNNDGM
ncbi:MAG: peptidylprolyl isomerase [Pirellulales bacterium]|nr:peptidylprolyl isomerase [Pirellulales bacterium]